jgi:hypothetical protein
MSRINDFDQLSAQITGLIDTARALTQAEQYSWWYITTALSNMPVHLKVEAVYYFMLGVVQMAQSENKGLTEACKFLTAAEKALHQVCHTRRMLEPENDEGPFVSWFKAKKPDINRNLCPACFLLNQENGTI